jgi:hypothetical protein
LTGKREKNLSAALRTHPKRGNFADFFAIRIFYEYNMGPGLFWELFFPVFLDLLPGGVCSLAGPPWWYFLAW